MDVDFKDINHFVKLEIVTKDDGSVFFYVTRYLMK